MLRFLVFVFAAVLAGRVPALAQDALITRASAEVSISGAQHMAQEIRRALAGRVAVELYNRPVKGYPAGSRLHVRVVDVSVGQEEAMRKGGASLFDSMQGEVIVFDARGAEIERKSLTAWPRWSVQSESGTRLQALVAAFAYTAVHKVGR
jgi:hypothetical protein